MMANLSISLSKNLRDMRQRLGFSQEYLATKLGLSQQVYSKIENDPSTASLKRLMQLAEIFEISVLDLLEAEQWHHSHRKTLPEAQNLSAPKPVACHQCLHDFRNQIEHLAETIERLNSSLQN
jgi:transcriptional regulator with XRE-family HTH domain